MTNETIERLQASFDGIAPRGEVLMDRFYALLFERHPAVRPMFPQDMKSQKSKLLASLGLVVKSLRTPEALSDTLIELGRRHAAYGTQPEHYPAVRDTLLASMGEVAGGAWTKQLAQEWGAAIDWVAQKMMQGHPAGSPPAAAR